MRALVRPPVPIESTTVQSLAQDLMDDALVGAAQCAGGNTIDKRSADGQRFLMVKDNHQDVSSRELVTVLGWKHELLSIEQRKQ